MSLALLFAAMLERNRVACEVVADVVDCKGVEMAATATAADVGVRLVTIVDVVDLPTNTDTIVVG